MLATTLLDTSWEQQIRGRLSMLQIGSSRFVDLRSTLHRCVSQTRTHRSYVSDHEPGQLQAVHKYLCIGTNKMFRIRKYRSTELLGSFSHGHCIEVLQFRCQDCFQLNRVFFLLDLEKVHVRSSSCIPRLLLWLY